MANQVQTITVNIPSLEGATNLSPVYLQLIKQQAGNFQYNQYAAFLYVLVNGAKSLGIKIQPQNFPLTTLIDENFIKKVWNIQNANPTLYQILKTITPAGQNGLFNNSGEIGISNGANPHNQVGHLVVGENNYLPPLLQHALQKISYSFFDSSSAYLAQLRAQSYLSSPKSIFGSIEHVASKAIITFEQLVMDIYKGAIKAIQYFVTYINGIMSQIQNYINNIVEQVLPSNFLCLILQVLQFITKDIQFFTAIFSNITSISNIQSLLKQYIKQLNLNGLLGINPSILDTIQQFVNNPQAYVSGTIRNLAFTSMLQSLQSNFLKMASTNFAGNLSYAGSYTSFSLPGLLNDINQEITVTDSGIYNQLGINPKDTQRTNRYGEQSVPVPTSFFQS